MNFFNPKMNHYGVKEGRVYLLEMDWSHLFWTLFSHMFFKVKKYQNLLRILNIKDLEPLYIEKFKAYGLL